MDLKHLNILLADDDTDDCIFFIEALKEYHLTSSLTTVHNGEELMQTLTTEPNFLPHVLFLDINMPRKNGFECLIEIKANLKLKDLPVVMFSTSFPQDKNYEETLINSLYKMGAHQYIRKTGDLKQLKKIIHNTLNMVAENKSIHEPLEKL